MNLRLPFAFFIILCLISASSLRAQRIVSIINKTEKAVFSVTSYANDLKIDQCTGFFINPYGIGVAPAYLFQKADSAMVQMRSGRKYKIKKIISVHPASNMAMFTIVQNREHAVDFLNPSQKAIYDKEEVLIFGDPDEVEDGVTFGRTNRVAYLPYINRVVGTTAEYGINSSGAPVINSNGDLVGIAGHLANDKRNYIISTYVINDTAWIPIPDEYGSLRSRNPFKYQYALFFNKGIVNLLYDDWVGAAKMFSQEIKVNPDNVTAYIFRAYVRKKYQNLMGSTEDFNKVKALDPNHFLQHYYKYMSLKEENNDKEAIVNLSLCLDKHPRFGLALEAYGSMILKMQENIPLALDYYNEAIQAAPFLASGYYERGRLMLQYFDEEKMAEEDFDKTIQLNSRLPGAYTIRGNLKAKKSDFLNALNDYTMALEIDSKDTYAYFNRGMAHYNLGMKEEACEDWDMANRLGHFKASKYISRYCSEVQKTRRRK